MLQTLTRNVTTYTVSTTQVSKAIASTMHDRIRPRRMSVATQIRWLGQRSTSTPIQGENSSPGSVDTIRIQPTDATVPVALYRNHAMAMKCMPLPTAVSTAASTYLRNSPQRREEKILFIKPPRAANGIHPQALSIH